MFNRVLISLFSILLSVSLYTEVRAADENMDSSVYLAFDPATGQFVSKTKSTTDGNQTVDTGIDPGQLSPVQPQNTVTQTDSAPAVQQTQVAAEPAAPAPASSNRMLLGIAAVLVIVGGFFVLRKRNQATNG